MKKISLTLLMILTASFSIAEDTTFYLALRHAYFNADDETIRKYIADGLKAEPENRLLLEEATMSAIYHRDLTAAQEHVKQLEASGYNSIVTKVTNFANMLVEGDFEEAAKYTRNSEELAFVSPEILEAWALAEEGKIDEAMDTLDTASRARQEWQPVYQYQKAMINGYVGNYAAMETLINNDGEPIYFSDLSLYNRIAALVLAKDSSYEVLMEEQFGSETLWPQNVSTIIEQAKSGKISPSLGFKNPQNAITEYLGFMLLQPQGETVDYGIERLFTTLIPAIVPENDWQKILLLGYFFRKEEYEDVVKFASEINDKSAFRIDRDEFLIDAFILMDQHSDAEEIIKNAPMDYLNQIAFKAEIQRALQQYKEAALLYETALEKTGRENHRYWQLLYGLAICYERLDNWKKAEPIFRSALELSPNNPDLLNYFGYSLVDRGDNLDEGLEMINKAVEQAPNEAAIIDSLGWAYYKLGRYDEALAPLEQATALMSTDATVNAHLGDLYWQLDRKREAGYQWKRALLFVTDDAVDVTRTDIENRLANGLEP